MEVTAREWTLVKKRYDQLGVMLADLADKLLGQQDEKTAEELYECAKLLLKSRDRLKAVRKYEEAEEDPNLLKAKKRRQNALSKRIFTRDKHACVVCGKILEYEKLSRVRLVERPKEDSDFTTMCKEHSELFRKKIPWEDRSREDSLYVVRNMESLSRLKELPNG